MTGEAAYHKNLATIRRQRLFRYERAQKLQKLENDIRRNTAQRNYQIELGKLYEASIRAHGLDNIGLKRMDYLIKKLRSL